MELRRNSLELHYPSPAKMFSGVMVASPAPMLNGSMAVDHLMCANAPLKLQGCNGFTPADEHTVTISSDTSLRNCAHVANSGTKEKTKTSMNDIARDTTFPLRIKELNGTQERWHLVNSPEPFCVESDEIHNGRAILKVRTAHIDKKKENPYAEYFKGRQRMLEIMVETQFKHIGPNDRVYIGIESTKPVKLQNIFHKAIAKAIMALIEATVPHSHTTLGEEGREVCMLVFPLDSTADRFCVTPPGDTPPTLGVQMFPDQYSPEKRPKFSGDYDPESTYSFSFHSMYVDLVKWELCNLPGAMDSVSLNVFLKNIPLRFVGYTLPKTHRGPHRQSEKRYLFAFELVNSNHIMK